MCIRLLDIQSDDHVLRTKNILLQRKIIYLRSTSLIPARNNRPLKPLNSGSKTVLCSLTSFSFVTSATTVSGSGREHDPTHFLTTSMSSAITDWEKAVKGHNLEYSSPTGWLETQRKAKGLKALLTLLLTVNVEFLIWCGNEMWVTWSIAQPQVIYMHISLTGLTILNNTRSSNNSHLKIIRLPLCSNL